MIQLPPPGDYIFHLSETSDPEHPEGGIHYPAADITPEQVVVAAAWIAGTALAEIQSRTTPERYRKLVLMILEKPPERRTGEKG